MKTNGGKKKAQGILGYVNLENAKLFYSSLREVCGSPQRSAAQILNLQGELLTDSEPINKRWSEHSKQLLNRSSSTDPNVIEEIPARPLHMEFDDPPTEDDVKETTDECQCGKSAGPDGILPAFFLKQMVRRRYRSLLTSFVRAGRMAVRPKIWKMPE